MSDSEEKVQTKQTSLEDSSGDESSSEAVVEKNEFSSRDGEPVNRPRKDSTSSSSSDSSSSEAGEAAEKTRESEDESSVSAVSKSEASAAKSVSSSSESAVVHERVPTEDSTAEPEPQPRSRSVSVDEPAPVPAPAERKKSLASTSEEIEPKAPNAEDTDDEIEDLEEPVKEVPVPVPVERKVSVPVQNDPPTIEIHEEIEEIDNELTQDEVECSKRETVHLDEAQKDEVIAEVTRKSSSDSDSESETKPQEDEKMVPEPQNEPEVVHEPPQQAVPAQIIEEDISVKDEVEIEATHESSEDASSSSEDEMMVKSSHEEAEQPIKSPELSSLTNRIESPLNGRRSANTNGDVTKIWTTALDNNNQKTLNNNNNIEKSGDLNRSKPTKDITQIYTQTIAKASPPASPRSAPRGRPATDITKLYTGKLETSAKTGDAAAAEKISPRKHNMSTAVDRDAIRNAYEDVRSDNSDTEWAVFKFDEGNRLGVTATGKEFPEFKSYFGTDERGFGYIRIKTGDEMSKRAKFIFVTWVGQDVSVMKKAKMSTDKALMKDVIQNMSVELQLENHGEFCHDHFKMQVDKASGARYGTGVRDL